MQNYKGNEIIMRNLKESFAALHIQRGHKINKDDRSTRVYIVVQLGYG